jgi:hypothetical protein
MHQGGRLEVCLTIAVLLALWSLQLLIPNPIMPQSIAHLHLFEILFSNFTFGMIIGLLLA